MRAQRAAYRKTVHRVHIEPGQRGLPAQQVEGLLKTFFLVFMAFNDGDDLPTRAVLRERFGEAVRLLAMIFRGQHARYDRNMRARRHKLAHQFTGQASIQPRFHAHDAGAAAVRGVGRDANHGNASFLGLVDQGLEARRISGGQ